ncbi:MAG: C4-dicarboxylate ABC transporter [Limnobacter sp. CACIAM 66H1]|jgi:TRAP-type mannitol/chloroaromatic compound transport system substrate-binding protein|uniref:TRAP transporter substrate-binding protein n=1 Tax=Limnobacter sp. CACIAM 66H1 TaxID=1813033 RepID=UPI0007A87F9A|nr:TRAP transporter substrate-binding protein [Limnobacter sp. CACIAM 66H1]KYP11268.1 MAG: C4-dicarboxylate ABC transporter [Limnobacter sp. CACIAM 66H1]
MRDDSRRRFVQKALAAGAAGAIATPAASQSASLVKTIKPVVFKFQSTWPTKDIFNEFAQDFAKKVNDMSGGELRIDVYPTNSIVKAFGIQNAVHKGQLDGGHGVPTYWHDRHAAFSLFGSGPSFGMSSNQILAWFQYGGGQQLYDELVQKEMNLNIQGFMYGPLTPQPLGWFKNRIESIKDLDKMRFRAVGLAAEVFKELGLTTTALQPADIVPWLDKGLIDAAEFNNPSSDRALGFPSVSSVCMIRSFHQSSEVFEVIFNKQRFDSLPFALRSIIRYALQASSADLSWKASDRFSTDYEEMRRKQGVRYYVTPDDILRAQLNAWRKIIARESANSRIFKRIIDSQMRFAKRVVGFENDLTPSSKMAFDFWFSTV